MPGIIHISWNKETFSYSVLHGILDTDAGPGACPVLFKDRNMKCR
jgi:hypothetical protein